MMCKAKKRSIIYLSKEYRQPLILSWGTLRQKCPTRWIHTPTGRRLSRDWSGGCRPVLPLVDSPPPPLLKLLSTDQLMAYTLYIQWQLTGSAYAETYTRGQWKKKRVRMSPLVPETRRKVGGGGRRDAFYPLSVPCQKTVDALLHCFRTHSTLYSCVIVAVDREQMSNSGLTAYI